MLHTRTFKTLLALILLLALVIPAGIASASKPTQSGFVKYGPSNGYTMTTTSVTIVWGSSSGATSYQYCYDTVNNGSCDNSWNYTTSTTASLSLSNNTTYYWQVRASGPSGTVDANGGTWWSFLVSVVPPTITPSPFVKSVPANGATNQQINSQLIAWSAYASGASYEYCYDTSNNGTCDSGGSWIVNGTNQHAFLNGLTYSTTYYWQVRANGGAGYANGSSSSTWSFTTVAAPTPTRTATRTPTPTLSPAFIKYGPANGSSVQSSTIVWGSSAGVSFYQYCYDTVNNNSCDNSWTSTGTNTMATLSISTNVVYYWQVRATTSGGLVTEANGGTWWSFTMVPTPTPPPPFGKSNPANGSVFTGTSPLAWNASSGAATYQYCLDTINNGACDTAWVSTGSNQYVFISGLTNGFTYSWQVRALNSSGVVINYANSSTWWTFTKN